MNTLSKHLLLELFECQSEALDNPETVQSSLEKAAQAAQVTIVKSFFHRFSPQGVTGVVIIEESHLSIHTWPEHGYASIDFYTCGEANPEAAIAVVSNCFAAKRIETMMIERGLSLQGQAMRQQYHQQLND